LKQEAPVPDRSEPVAPHKAKPDISKSLKAVLHELCKTLGYGGTVAIKLDQILEAKDALDELDLSGAVRELDGHVKRAQHYIDEFRPAAMKQVKSPVRLALNK
jgi:hypothetical protein